MKPSNRPPISPDSPVEGLARRQLSFLPVFAQAVAAVAPAGAMSVIPALVLGLTGPALLIAFACAMGIMVLVAASMRPMTQRMAAVSGLYSYIAKGLGPVPAVMGGWSAIFGYGLVAMASILAVGTYLERAARLAGLAGTSTPDGMVLSLVLVAGIAAAALMIRGLRVSAGVTLLVECASIAIFTVLMLVYLWPLMAHVNGSAVLRWDGRWDSLSVGVVVAVSAFVGFESATTLGGEARRTFQTIPRVLRWTPILIGGIYLCGVAAQGVAFANAAPTLSSSPTPLSDLFSTTSSLMAVLLDIGIASSFFACTIASVNALARILFCMGREGVAPRVLGKAHGRFRTPYAAVLAAMPVVVIVPSLLMMSGSAPEQILTQLFMLGAYGYLGSYLLASLATPAFLRKIGESTPGAWVIGILSSLCVAAVSWAAATSTLAEGSGLGLIYFAVIAGAGIYAWVLRARGSERLRRVGIYDETRETDLMRTPFSRGSHGR